MVDIKFCENNFSQGTEDIVKKIEYEFKNMNVEIEPCLGYCGDCAMGPFALVNDELVQADNADQLYGIIKNELM